VSEPKKPPQQQRTPVSDRGTPSQRQRILVLAPNKPFLGAQLVQLPFLSELRSRNPEAVITLALPFSGPSVFETFVFHDEIVAGWAESRRATARFAGGVVGGRFDCVYSLRGRSARAGLVTLCSGARRRVGYRLGGSRLFFNVRVRPRERVYLALKYLDLLDGGRDEVPEVPLWTPEIERRVEALFRERALGPPAVGLFVGAGGSKKRWPVGNFLALESEIRAARPGAEVLHFLSPEDASGPMGRELAGVEARRKLSFEDLRFLACAFSRCTALISADCGPAHLGHLLGLPQVVLFDGGGRPHEWFRPRPHARFLMAEDRKTVSSFGVREVRDAALGVIRASTPRGAKRRP